MVGLLVGQEHRLNRGDTCQKIIGIAPNGVMTGIASPPLISYSPKRRNCHFRDVIAPRSKPSRDGAGILPRVEGGEPPPIAHLVRRSRWVISSFLIGEEIAARRFRPLHCPVETPYAFA